MKSIIIAVVTALLVAAIAHAADSPINHGGRHGPVHYYSGPEPTLTGCSACTIASYSTSARGKITCTDGTQTCTVTFAWPYAENPPACVLTGTTDVNLAGATTTHQFSFTTGVGVNAYYYVCDGFLERGDYGTYTDPDA